METRAIKRIAAALTYLLCALFAFAQNNGLPRTADYPRPGDLSVKSGPDWEKGTLRLEITVRLDLDRLRFPEARQAAEERARDARSGLFLDAFDALTLRSSQTVGEFLADPEPDPRVRRVMAAIPTLSQSALLSRATVSADFKSLTVVYEYPFYGEQGLVAPFVAGDSPRPLPASPGYYATRAFTGLVIDARGKNFSFGKNVEEACRPAFFPRLFYLSSRRTIEPVLDMTMVDPRVLVSRGMVGYVRTTEKSGYAARAGADPLLVTAFAVYGTYDTDLVISEEAARTLLASEANRDLLRRGKIVVIID
jgi:hypothetical protein